MEWSEYERIPICEYHIPRMNQLPNSVAIKSPNSTETDISCNASLSCLLFTVIQCSKWGEYLLAIQEYHTFNELQLLRAIFHPILFLLSVTAIGNNNHMHVCAVSSKYQLDARAKLRKTILIFDVCWGLNAMNGFAETPI